MTLNRFFPKKGWAIALLALGLMFSACDSNNEGENAELTDADLLTAVDELTAELGLSAIQSNGLRTAFAKHQRRSKEPGFWWYAAAELHATLSEEELASLLNKANNRQRANRAERDRANWGDRGNWGDRENWGNWGDRRNQNGDQERERGGFWTDLLTEEQKEALKAFRQEQAETVKAMFQALRNGELTREDAAEQRKAMGEAMKTFMDNLLTDEQKAEIEAKRAERKAKAEERIAAEKAAMQDALGLTTEQMDALAEARKAAAEDMKSTLSGLRESGDREAIREALATLKANSEAAIQGIVGEDAYEIMQIHRCLASHRARKAFGDRRNNGGGDRG